MASEIDRLQRAVDAASARCSAGEPEACVEVAQLQAELARAKAADKASSGSLGGSGSSGASSGSSGSSGASSGSSAAPAVESAAAPAASEEIDVVEAVTWLVAIGLAGYAVFQGAKR